MSPKKKVKKSGQEAYYYLADYEFPSALFRSKEEAIKELMEMYENGDIDTGCGYYVVKVVKVFVPQETFKLEEADVEVALLD